MGCYGGDAEESAQREGKRGKARSGNCHLEGNNGLQKPRPPYALGPVKQERIEWGSQK